MFHCISCLFYFLVHFKNSLKLCSLLSPFPSLGNWQITHFCTSHAPLCIRSVATCNAFRSQFTSVDASTVFGHWARWLWPRLGQSRSVQSRFYFGHTMRHSCEATTEAGWGLRVVSSPCTPTGSFRIHCRNREREGERLAGIVVPPDGRE